MTHKNWCGNKCCECKKDCLVNQSIPCSPSCDNLIGENINIRGCLDAGCEEVYYIFDVEVGAEEELINAYGKVAEYPYSI